MALKKVVRLDNTDSFKFENKGDKLEGYYKKTTEVTINGQNVKKHIFETANGLVSVLGQFDLGKQLAEVPANSRVVATLMGIQKLKGGKTMKIYDVAYDDADVSESAATSEACADDLEDAYEEAGVDEDEISDDEIKTPATRVASNKPAASAPSAANQAKFQAMLQKAKTKIA